MNINYLRNFYVGRVTYLTTPRSAPETGTLNRFNFQICLRLSLTLPNKLGINILAIYLIYIYDDTHNPLTSPPFALTQNDSRVCADKMHQCLLCGVTQGSVLGPLLFLLYINDINNSSKKFSFFLFADDTNLLYADKHLKTLKSRCKY
jgi:hypothetical protein